MLVIIWKKQTPAWRPCWKIKYQFQPFVLFQFLIQPLWTQRYLPVSQEWWTLTPNDEFYPPFYQTRYWKKPTGFKDCSIHLRNPREAPPTSDCCFKASLFSKLTEVIRKHLNQSVVSVLEVFEMQLTALFLCSFHSAFFISFIRVCERVKRVPAVYSSHTFAAFKKLEQQEMTSSSRLTSPF